MIHPSLFVVSKVKLVFLKAFWHFLSAVLSSELQALFAQHLFIWRCEVISLVLQVWNGFCCHSRCICQKLLSEHKSRWHMFWVLSVCVWMEAGMEVKETLLFTLPAGIQTSSDSALSLPAQQLSSHSAYFMASCNGLIPLFHQSHFSMVWQLCSQIHNFFLTYYTWFFLLTIKDFLYNWAIVGREHC